MAQLGTLRANVIRNIGGLGDFYDPQDINVLIGEAYQHYFNVMTMEGAGYFETKVNLNLVGNVESIDLSDPAVLDPAFPVFKEISSLERNTSLGTFPLRASERRFDNNLTYYRGAGLTYQPTYKMRGMLLILEPSPPSSETVTSVLGVSTTGLKLDYIYVPVFPVFDSPDDFEFNLSFSSVYDPMIVLYATIGMLEGKDAMGGVSDIASFRGRLEKWEQRFIDSLDRTEYPDSVSYSGQQYNDWPFDY